MLIKNLAKSILIFSLSNFISIVLFFAIDIFVFKNGDFVKWGGLWGAFQIATFFGLFLVLSNSIGYLLFLITIINNSTFKNIKFSILSGIICIFPVVFTSGNLTWPDWISFPFRFGDVVGLIIGWVIVAFCISVLMYLLLKFGHKIFKGKYLKDIISIFTFLIIILGCSNKTELNLNTNMLGKSIEEAGKYKSI